MDVALTLFGYAVAFLLKKIKPIKKSKTCVVVEPKHVWTVKGWLEREGIEAKKNKVIIYKRVSSDFRTQEDTSNQTFWEVGSVMDHPEWKPATGECGEGKFHACSRPYFCDAFRNGDPTDKYVAIEAKVPDLHCWKDAQYAHKIAFRRGLVLFQCDKWGKKV